jgi:hypothetical protein
MCDVYKYIGWGHAETEDNFFRWELPGSEKKQNDVVTLETWRKQNTRLSSLPHFPHVPTTRQGGGQVAGGGGGGYKRIRHEMAVLSCVI